MRRRYGCAEVPRRVRRKVAGPVESYGRLSELECSTVGPATLVSYIAEVEEFKRDFWPEHLYLDEDKAFFKAVGGGKLKKGSLSAFLNPFSRIWKHAGDAKKAGVKEHNLNGEGLIMGGMFVMKPGSQGVQYQFQERNFGDHAPIEDVLAAAKAASEASK